MRNALPTTIFASRWMGRRSRGLGDSHGPLVDLDAVEVIERDLEVGLRVERELVLVAEVVQRLHDLELDLT